jgi:type IV secretory pathway protease TraF
MLPALQPGSLVIAAIRQGRGAYRPGQVVIIAHDGIEKVKRITAVRPEVSAVGDGRGVRGRRNNRETVCEIFVKGDNDRGSSDSRDFGWLSVKTVKGRVIWPVL